MKKKILIGSIIAVALLVLVSFSSVVGYNSVKSDTKIASPLFSIINNKGEVSSNYLGKGEDKGLSIPRRDENNIMIQKILKMISKMSDEEYKVFFDSIKERLPDDVNEFNFKTDNPHLGFATFEETTPFGCILSLIYLFIAIIIGAIAMGSVLIHSALFPTACVGYCILGIRTR